MTSSLEPKEPIKFLGNFGSILSLLGICLFFSGWIYRWAYYSFFQLEITRLDLSSQSFLLVPLQIFLGSPVNILKSALILAFIPILVNLTLWIVGLLQNLINQILSRIPQLKAFWQHISDTNQTRFASTSFFQSLLKELIIVTWVLLLIFWFSSYQGKSDARRDAVNETSTLPVVTLITNPKNLILGQDLTILNNEIPADPNITNNVMIGDINLAKIIRSYGINDLKEQRVWRLLTERGGWIFLFPTLSQKSDANDRPLILAIPKGYGEQLMILSPTIPK